jgi:phosphatidylinositol alpha-mannosyltransferase
MKICVVCPYSLSMPGGVQNQSILLSQQFIARGHDVLLIAPGEMPIEVPYETYQGKDNAYRGMARNWQRGKYGNFLSRLRFWRAGNTESEETGETGDSLSTSVESKTPVHSGMIVFYTVGKSAAVPANGSVAPVTLSLKAANDMLKTIRGWSPDVVHVHEPFTPVLSLGASWRVRKKRSGNQVVMAATFHRSGAGHAYKAAGVTLRTVYAKLDLCYAVSKSAQHTLAKVIGVRNSQKASVVFNGIDFGYLSTVKPYRDRYVLGDKSVFEICFVGRLEPRKGLEVLLKALVDLEDQVRVNILGTGAEMARLQAEYSTLENIFWLGRVSDGEKYARMKAADLLVAPALTGESFGIVVLEAMALSVPVVCSNIPGYRASAGDAAFFVAPNDHMALRKAMSTLIKDADLRGKLVAKGILRAEQMSVSNLADRYLQDFYGALSDLGKTSVTQ